MHEIKKQNKRKKKRSGCRLTTTNEHKMQPKSQGRLRSDRLKSSSQAATQRLYRTFKRQLYHASDYVLSRFLRFRKKLAYVAELLVAFKKVVFEVHFKFFERLFS